MAEKIAIIDFPLKDKETSFFVVNGAEGRGGLVARIKENGFELNLIDYRTLDSLPINPENYAAVFFASGWTHIRDPEAITKDPKTRKINSELESACNLYDKCIEEQVPVIAFPHGGQSLTFYTGGDYFKLDEPRTRKEPFGRYTPTNKSAPDHWLLNNIPIQVLQSEKFAREYREYGLDLANTQFKALVNPDLDSTGPAITIHKDPAITSVLFMMHPEYDKNLPAYRLMENVFAKLKE